MDFHVTEVSIAVKLWCVILWYCISPHAVGIRLYQPEKWGPAREWTRYL